METSASFIELLLEKTETCTKSTSQLSKLIEILTIVLGELPSKFTTVFLFMRHFTL